MDEAIRRRRQSLRGVGATRRLEPNSLIQAALNCPWRLLSIANDWHLSLASILLLIMLLSPHLKLSIFWEETLNLACDTSDGTRSMTANLAGARRLQTFEVGHS